LQSLVAKCGKYSLAKFAANFVSFVLPAEIATTFGPKMVAISVQKNTKFANFARLYFPHFTTFRNLCHFTHFGMLEIVGRALG
jgi:hypothetical protein